VAVDENYIRQSILQPQAKIVKGFTGATMPPFVLKDWKIDALIEYIKSVK
jgi:cytochrome c oxidase subunit 2